MRINIMDEVRKNEKWIINLMCVEPTMLMLDPLVTDNLIER